MREIRALKEALGQSSTPSRTETNTGAEERTRVIKIGHRKGEKVAILALFTGKQDGEQMARVRYEDDTIGLENARFLIPVSEWHER